MAAVPVPPPPLPASHAAVRAAASAVSHSIRVRRAGDHPPQVAALRRGDWVKLICGASFEDAADVRNLSLVYTLAGEFDPEDCPPDCSKPCEKVCPADAISLERAMVGGEHTRSDPLRGKHEGGVITERCYGCGRCLPICPYDRIRAVSYVRDPTMTAELLKSNDVDAIEIHTTGKGTDMFNTLWDSLSGSINNVKLVAVSLPDIGESTVDLMNTIYTVMEPHLQGYNLWQLDGRPMSGDIGRGATRETVSFAVHVASMSERPPGFYQLAGGTNSYTIDCLKKVGLFKSITFSGTATSEMASCHQALIGGIAYGGYARKIVGRALRKIPEQFGRVRIEDHPDHLLEALQEAMSLVGPVKGYISSPSKPFMKQVDRQ